jgi:two-component system, response regulator RpfG
VSSVTGGGGAPCIELLKVLGTRVALAEDRTQVQSEKWRSVALTVFCISVGAIGFFMLVFVPPQLDFRPATIASVLFVAVFLAFTQRPTQAAGKSYAPLTAVVAASAVVFGYWTVLLVLVSFAAIRLRMGPRESALGELFSSKSFAQAGTGILATYGMIAVWSGVVSFEKLAPPWADAPLTLLGIILVGLVWQVAQHGLTQIGYSFIGKASYSFQFVRLGIFASLYGYLLVAMYSFGGLLTATLFYTLVAQPRIVQDIIGVARRLHQFDHARAQATSIVRELMRFTDAPDVQFTGDVENIAQMLARHMGFSRKEITDVGLAAELHEIGKSRLPARLRWGRKSNAAEAGQRRTYSRLGAIMLRNADALVDPEIADYIEYHTEHFDGTGYPKGLSGEAIPSASRIIAVARAYVCLLTGYDGALPMQKEEALRRLHQDSGTLFDPRLVDLLTELVS